MSGLHVLGWRSPATRSAHDRAVREFDEPRDPIDPIEPPEGPEPSDEPRRHPQRRRGDGLEILGSSVLGADFVSSELRPFSDQVHAANADITNRGVADDEWRKFFDDYMKFYAKASGEKWSLLEGPTYWRTQIAERWRPELAQHVRRLTSFGPDPPPGGLPGSTPSSGAPSSSPGATPPAPGTTPVPLWKKAAYAALAAGVVGGGALLLRRKG